MAVSQPAFTGVFPKAICHAATWSFFHTFLSQYSMELAAWTSVEIDARKVPTSFHPVS